jgi:hypothetical protein
MSAEQQPLDRLAADEVALDDLRHVLGADVRVPDVVRIDRDHRPVSALSEASRLVDAHAVLAETLLRERLHRGVDGLGAVVRTRLPRHADEHVPLERSRAGRQERTLILGDVAAGQAGFSSRPR